MNNQEIALLTQHIFDKLFEIGGVNYHTKYRGVLYMIIKEKLDGYLNNSQYEDNGYNDYKGNHNFRKEKSRAKINDLQLLDYDIEEGIVTFSNNTNYDNIRDFPFQNYPLYDDCIVERWIVNQHFSIQDLFNFTNDLWDLFNRSVNKYEPLKNYQIKDVGSDLDLDYRYKGVYNIYQNMVANYDNADDNVRSYFEVVLGAALFYLPQPVHESWLGDISINLLRSMIVRENNSIRMVKDHVFARKRAAHELLNNLFTLDDFCNEYDNKYRKFTYVTSAENNSLVNWHIEYETYAEALINNNIYLINLINIGIEHASIKKFIRHCISAGKPRINNLAVVEWSNDPEIFTIQIGEMVEQFLAQN